MGERISEEDARNHEAHILIIERRLLQDRINEIDDRLDKIDPDRNKSIVELIIDDEDGTESHEPAVAEID